MKTSKVLGNIIEKARKVGETKVGKDGKTRVWSKTPSGFDWRRVKGSKKTNSGIGSAKNPKKKVETKPNKSKEKTLDYKVGDTFMTTKGVGNIVSIKDDSIIVESVVGKNVNGEWEPFAFEVKKKNVIETERGGAYRSNIKTMKKYREEKEEKESKTESEIPQLRERKREIEYKLKYSLDNIRDNDSYSGTTEEKDLKKELAKIRTKLAKNIGKLKGGETYEVNDFIDSLKYTGLTDNPEKKFKKDNSDQHWGMKEEDMKVLDKIIDGEQSIYNYFNREYSPTDIKIEKVGEDKEKVESSSIYAQMAAKTITHFKGSFKVKLNYKDDPITIEREFSANTTLSMSDINNFL